MGKEKRKRRKEKRKNVSAKKGWCQESHWGHRFESNEARSHESHKPNFCIACKFLQLFQRRSFSESTCTFLETVINSLGFNRKNRRMSFLGNLGVVRLQVKLHPVLSDHQNMTKHLIDRASAAKDDRPSLHPVRWLQGYWTAKLDEMWSSHRKHHERQGGACGGRGWCQLFFLKIK